jgi:hypothetical protein
MSSRDDVALETEYFDSLNFAATLIMTLHLLNRYTSLVSASTSGSGLWVMSMSIPPSTGSSDIVIIEPDKK